MHHAADGPTTVAEALALLKSTGALVRLLRHAELVASVAGELVDAIAGLGLTMDRDAVVLGAALHDAGKIDCPAELTGPGHEHEVAGEKLLLELGVAPGLARFCRTHGLPASNMPASEDLVVAVADKLWRGVRKEGAELALVNVVAQRLGGDRWAVFMALDACFERIANDGDHRLARQRDA